MKRFGAAVASLALAGCLYTVDPWYRPRTPIVEHDANCIDIAIAESRRRDDDAREAYLALARRPGLTPHEQRHLADSAIRQLDEDDVLPVLLAVIERSDFAIEARTLIVSNLRRLPRRERKAVEDALLGSPPGRVASTDGGAPAPPVSGWGLLTESASGAVRVSAVEKGSPAERAGVAPGDVVLAVGEWIVRDAAGWEAALASLEALKATEAAIEIRRGETRLTFYMKR